MLWCGTVLNVVLSSKGVNRKFFEKRGGGKRKHQDREIVLSISLPPFYQSWVRGHTRNAPRAHLKGMLYLEPRVKSEDLFIDTYFQKNVYLFRKLQPNFV